MARSPIEMMIDQATGYDPAAPKPPRRPKVMLHCPKCGRKQKADMDKDDPPGTAVVQVQCPKCVGGDFDTPAYFDANGNEIPWHESFEQSEKDAD